MKSTILVLGLIVPLLTTAQSSNRNVMENLNNVEISGLNITNAKKIEFIDYDSTLILGNKYKSKKYYVKCKAMKPTRFTETGQYGYFKGTFHYEIFVINDSSLIIRDTLINSIYEYLNSPSGLIRKNIFTKGVDFLLLVDKGTNDYGDYLIYWYHNIVYKIVLTKSRILFWTDIGGLWDIDIQFKTRANEKFFPYDYDGLQAYKRLKEILN